MQHVLLSYGQLGLFLKVCTYAEKTFVCIFFALVCIPLRAELQNIFLLEPAFHNLLLEVANDR